MDIKCILLVSALHFNYILLAQNPLSVFENLIGSNWEVSGKWSFGDEFRQDYSFEWGLNKKLIKVKTNGTINRKTGEYGLRNEGIRFWKEDEEIIKFFEFDTFGGVTEGNCIIEGNNILYYYNYNGAVYRDSWIYQDKNSYQFIVELLEDNVSKETYLNAVIRRKID